MRRIALCTASRHVSSKTRRRATKDNVANLRSALKGTARIIATGTLEMGKEISVIQPVCVALERMKNSWDEIQRNEERLGGLHELCEVISSFVVVNCYGSKKNVDITPLKEYVDDLEVLVADYSRRGLCSRFCNRDSEVIEQLGRRLEHLVPIMDLAATVAVSEQVTAMGSSVDQLKRQLEGYWERNESLPGETTCSTCRTWYRIMLSLPLPRLRTYQQARFQPRFMNSLPSPEGFRVVSKTNPTRDLVSPLPGLYFY